MPTKINLKEERFILGHSVGKFQSVVAWPHDFWACGKVAQHGGEYMMEHTWWSKAA
jgi:hypothetical protein